MVHSFGEYTIAKSPSSDIKNIKFSQRLPVEPDKPKNKKKKRNISLTNIIYASTIEKSNTKKLFIFEKNNTKSKNKKKAGKSARISSASNYVIKSGFKRPGRYWFTEVYENLVYNKYKDHNVDLK